MVKNPKLPVRKTTDTIEPAVVPVEFVEPVIEQSAIEAPPGWDDAEESEAGLLPVAHWVRPGEYVQGTFIKMAEHVGPNKSRLYTLTLEDGQLVGIWGNTVLDDRIDKLSPKKGDGIMIQFLGTTQTARGLSPAKLFRVRLSRS